MGCLFEDLDELLNLSAFIKTSRDEARRPRDPLKHAQRLFYVRCGCREIVVFISSRFLSAIYIIIHCSIASAGKTASAVYFFKIRLRHEPSGAWSKLFVHLSSVKTAKCARTKLGERAQRELKLARIYAWIRASFVWPARIHSGLRLLDAY